MSVLIKNMEKPINCQHCIFTDYEGRFCYAAKEYIPMLVKPSFCPIVEQKKGKWIPIIKGEHGYSAGDFECSICAQPNHCYHLTNFCPNCGADMREKGENSESN